MKYIVNFNTYIKQLNAYRDIVRVFYNQKDAIEYISSMGKLKEWDSITLSVESE